MESRMEPNDPSTSSNCRHSKTCKIGGGNKKLRRQWSSAFAGRPPNGDSLQSATPPIVRAALLQSTLILPPSGRKGCNGLRWRRAVVANRSG